ncbi:MAG: hypothetical protein BGO41_12245 [Clostridiales bacterium 38-18]|nr:MAG: hypothetical protein BGO41_12245 [Clostridiales bacterium 38-18]
MYINRIFIKKGLRILGVFVGLVFALAIIVSLPTIVRGYDMYKNAISSEPIEIKVMTIKSDENYLRLSEIPKEYTEALIDSEDQRFYSHIGIDFQSTFRAVLENIKAKSYVQGGSTITQQLAKNMYFTFEKRLDRKVAELLVAFKLEQTFSKDDILELYCNVTYMGNGCYGINEASRYYFDKAPDELTQEEIEQLVQTIKNPGYRNPNSLSEDGTL